MVSAAGVGVFGLLATSPGLRAQYSGFLLGMFSGTRNIKHGVPGPSAVSGFRREG